MKEFFSEGHGRSESQLCPTSVLIALKYLTLLALPENSDMVTREENSDWEATVKESERYLRWVILNPHEGCIHDGVNFFRRRVMK
jgi:hypothetical protein